MKIEVLKINDIKNNPNNPRIIKDESFFKLVKSIKEFPEMLHIRPIVVNKEMIILWGNMRYKACKSAGLIEIPVMIIDNLTEEQEKEFIIKDNVSGGEWDFNILSSSWDIEELQEWGIIIPGLEDDIDFDNIKSNEDRENTKQIQNIICPKCEHCFSI